VNAFGWPDLLIGAIVLIGAFRGFARGFVAQLTGIVALTIAVIAAFNYRGQWDGAIAGVTHLGPGSAHVVAMSLFAIAAYAVTVAIGTVLSRFAKLPGIGLVNGVLGAGVGGLEAVALIWLVLYVALFFSLPNDLHADLRRSPLVATITAPNAEVDATVRSLIPFFARPFVGGFMDQHRL